jgi:peptide/nickel transport system ATP-binding protein
MRGTRLIELQDISKVYAEAAAPSVRALSFDVRDGEFLVLVGESGSGKTTTVRAVVGFQRPTSGRIVVAGVELGTVRGEPLRQLRRKIQLVYQNPFGSLDPRQSVLNIVEEPLLNYEPVAADARRKKAGELLERVGLGPELWKRRPRALSGGQRQRVAIARALVLDPEILVLDEAVSALDVTVQAQILGLLAELQWELGLTYLFVSHDLAVVRQISDTVSVLKDGRQVEAGAVEAIFRHPQDEYTRELIDAIPGRRLAARLPEQKDPVA